MHCRTHIKLKYSFSGGCVMTRGTLRNLSSQEMLILPLVNATCGQSLLGSNHDDAIGFHSANNGPLL